MANEPTAVETEVTELKEAEKPKSGKLPLILGGAIALLLLVGGGGAWYLHHSKVQASGAPAKADTRPAGIIHLESFIVNLADEGQITYLRASIDLGVDKVPVDKKEGDGTTPTARIRDAILGVLATRKSEELLTTEGKQKLKQDLIATLNDRVPEIGVREIYFTDFLVQR